MKKVAPICSNLSRKQGVAVTWTALTGRKVRSYSEELVKHEAGWIVNRRQAQDLSRAIHVLQ